MPIPGRMKIGMGNNTNKRHHWAPPSPQVDSNMVNTTVLGVPVPRSNLTYNNIASNGFKYNQNFNNDKSNNNNGYAKGSTSPNDMNISPLRPQRKTSQPHPIGMMELGSNSASNCEEHKMDLQQQRKPPRRTIGLTDFERIRVLGKGAFGKVLLVRNKRNKKIYAMKILKKNHVINKRQVAHTMSERHVLGRSKHPFVVQMHCAFQTVDKLIFVLDYCAGGDLYYHISRNGRLTEPRCRFYAAELAEALAHLHGRGVVYRDLKPENVMITAEGHVKLVDFGLSKENVRSAVEGASSYCGTPEYLAPEVMRDQSKRNYGTAIDWWSLGALMYEMLTGLPPWYSRDRETLFNGIKHGELTFPSYVSMQARGILKNFLCRDPLRRLGVRGSIQQIREHPFFENLDWEKLVKRQLIPPWLPKQSSQQGASANQLVGKKVNEEDLETMSTLYFDKVFTRLPVQSEASISPNSPQHQQSHNYLAMGKNNNQNNFEQGTKSTVAANNYLKKHTTPITTNGNRQQQQQDGSELFDGFSYISRKMLYPGAKSYGTGQSYGASNMQNYLNKSPKPSPSPSPPNRDNMMFKISPGSSPQENSPSMDIDNNFNYRIGGSSSYKHASSNGISLVDNLHQNSKSNDHNMNTDNPCSSGSRNSYNSDGSGIEIDKSFQNDAMNPNAQSWNALLDENANYGRNGNISPTWDMIEGGLDEVEGEMFDIDDMAF
jgi:serine/threonine protein kinase